MTISASAAAPATSRAESASYIWILAAILAAALVERAWFDTAPDVSWLLTLGEKMFAGERPYIDFIEVNPPASIFIYLPALAFARLVGVSPEFAVGLLVFAAAAASLWVSAIILIGPASLRTSSIWPVAAVFATMLLVLPATAFAQREHIALIALLPMLAVSTLRAQSKEVAWHWAVVAGIGAGVTAIIKPYFVLPVLSVVAASAICARSWRPVFALENWVSAGLAIVYAAAVVLAYPEFVFDLVPIIMAVYVSQKASWADLLTLGAIPFWSASLLAIIALKRRSALAPPFVVLIAASAGFLVSFAIQQKGVAYHSYPMLALILSAAVIAVFEPVTSANDGRIRRVCRDIAVTAIAGITVAIFSWYAVGIDLRPLIGPIEASAPRPTILNISGGGLEGMGFPLTRQVGGTWVGRTCGQWISAGAMAEKLKDGDAATTAVFDQYIERDRNALTQDIADKKPDIILVDRIRYDWLKWAKSAPALAKQLTNYRDLAEHQGILVLRRNSN